MLFGKVVIRPLQMFNIEFRYSAFFPLVCVVFT